MAYADVVMRHFYGPRNNHVMASPDAVGVAGQPGYGPFLVLYLRLEGDRVADASFQTHGCAPSIAAGSLLATELPGSTLAAATARWTEAAINEALGGLPEHKRHCSALAAEALLRAGLGSSLGREYTPERAPGAAPTDPAQPDELHTNQPNARTNT